MFYDSLAKQCAHFLGLSFAYRPLGLCFGHRRCWSYLDLHCSFCLVTGFLRVQGIDWDHPPTVRDLAGHNTRTLSPLLPIPVCLSCQQATARTKRL